MSNEVCFIERMFPSANMVIVGGSKPILIDTGFRSEISLTESLILANGCFPESIQLIINTHYHSDHVGANSFFQNKYGTQIATHRWEAGLINNNDKEAWCARWLDQPVEPYSVDCLLSDGDEVDGGIKVLHTPGHTLGHLCLFLPDTQALICGDLLSKNDVGWFNIFREGSASLEMAIDSLGNVAKLPLKYIYPGHGPVLADPLTTIDQARFRLEKWQKKPEKVAWHACKRIFVYALMIRDGLPESEIADYLMHCQWYRDISTNLFDIEPIDFIQPLLDEMLRSNAAQWRNGRLISNTPYNWSTIKNQ